MSGSSPLAKRRPSFSASLLRLQHQGVKKGGRTASRWLLKAGNSTGEKLGSEGTGQGRGEQEWLVPSAIVTLIGTRAPALGSDALLCNFTSLSRRANATL